MKLKNELISYKFEMIKIGTTSGASRNTRVYKNNLPFSFKYKQLMLNYKWKAGRSTNGRIVLWTRQAKTVKHVQPFINYKFRHKNIALIANFLLIPKRNKLISLLFLSSGAVTYVSTTTTHQLFQLTQLKGIVIDKLNLQKNIHRYHPLSIFTNIFFIIAKLPKNKPICLVETTPNKGIQYVRSTGSSASILKMDSRIGTALIKLPSGMKKVFSTYSIGSLGSVALPENKNFTNASAGYYRQYGVKAKVRGVAMNPIDHPHGGRTKSIKYQRTPWGKTTKFK